MKNLKEHMLESLRISINKCIPIMSESLRIGINDKPETTVEQDILDYYLETKNKLFVDCQFDHYRSLYKYIITITGHIMQESIAYDFLKKKLLSFKGMSAINVRNGRTDFESPMKDDDHIFDNIHNDPEPELFEKIEKFMYDMDYEGYMIEDSTLFSTNIDGGGLYKEFEDFIIIQIWYDEDGFHGQERKEFFILSK